MQNKTQTLAQAPEALMSSFQVNLKNIEHHVNFDRAKSEELKEAVERLQTLFFMKYMSEKQKEQMGLIAYLDSPEFTNDARVLDSMKLNLIQLITKI